MWRGRSSVFHVISHEKREETLIDELRFPLDEQFPGMIWTARPFSNSRTNVGAAVCVCERTRYIYIYIGERGTELLHMYIPYVYRCPFDVEISSNHDDDATSMNNYYTIIAKIGISRLGDLVFN